MRRFSDRHALSTLSELNVTPLLDLAFVLLIIFMITTPLMEKSVDVVLPSSQSAANAVDPAMVQTVALRSDGTLALNETVMDLPALELALGVLRVAQPETAVVVRSHRELPVQKLVAVLDAVQRARIAKVGVVTQPEP